MTTFEIALFALATLGTIGVVRNMWGSDLNNFDKALITLLVAVTVLEWWTP